MIAQTLADVGIELPQGRAGEIDTTCPRCSPSRKKSRAKCLSVNTIDGTWYCHHCGFSGGPGTNPIGYGARLHHRIATPPAPRIYTTPKPPLALPLPEEAGAWFANRGIPESVLIAAGITAGQEWCPQVGHHVLAVRFPYLRDGHLINIKYRALTEKHFWMVKGAERILYGLDDLLGADTICAVEGEMDKLSIDTAGGPPTFSVPDGAPAPDTRHYASKFSFLDETAMARLRAATTVLIATDMDPPGERLAQELARRIGYERCRRVSWHPYKDANEVLLALGPAAVRDALTNAHPIPAPDGVGYHESLCPSSRPVLRTRSSRLRVREVARA